MDIRIVGYPDKWISRPFWLAKYPDAKKIEFDRCMILSRYNLAKGLNIPYVPTLGAKLAKLLHNLVVNTDIFGWKGVYYPRSKLFSRQSVKAK